MFAVLSNDPSHWDEIHHFLINNKLQVQYGEFLNYTETIQECSSIAPLEMVWGQLNEVIKWWTCPCKENWGVLCSFILVAGTMLTVCAQ